MNNKYEKKNGKNINKEIDLLIITSKELANSSTSGEIENLKYTMGTDSAKVKKLITAGKAIKALRSFAEKINLKNGFHITTVEEIYEEYTKKLNIRTMLPFPYSHSIDATHALYIRSYLQQWKNETEDEYPAYLILAGDIEYIPAFYLPMEGFYPVYGDQRLKNIIALGEALGNLSDYYYGDLKSNYLKKEFLPPTLAVSRLPANTPEELLHLCIHLERKRDEKHDKKILTIASNQKFFDNGNRYLDTRYITGAMKVAKDIGFTKEKKEINPDGQQNSHDWKITAFKNPEMDSTHWHMDVCYQPFKITRKDGNIDELLEKINQDYSVICYRGDSWFDRWNVSENTNWNGLCFEHLIKDQIWYIPVVLSLATMTCMLEVKDHDRVGNTSRYYNIQGNKNPVFEIRKIIDNELIDIYKIGDISIDEECCFGKRWLLQQKTSAFLGMTRIPYLQYNQILNTAICKEIINKPAQTIGEIILKAIKNIYNEYSLHEQVFNPLKEQLLSYMLLGDVTVQLPSS